jgi:SecD/SecF fusion protein
MTSDDRLIAGLAKANPVSRTAKPGPHERAEADRVLHRVLTAPPSSPRRWPILAPVASALVVLGVVAAAVSVGGSSHSGAPAKGGLHIVLQAEPTPQTPVITPAAMSREVQIMSERLGTVLSSFRVSRSGADRVVVAPGKVAAGRRARIARLVSQPGELYFYDWEANALTPNGKTVASQLQTQDPQAIAISQGASFAAPGDPNAGSMPLYQAVQLAAKQARSVSSHNGRLGPQYYMFGAPGSDSCAAKAKAQGTTPAAGRHCLLAGPDNEPYTTSRQKAIQNLAAQLPPGVTPSEGQALVVQQGTVVLQAANSSASQQTKHSTPSAQFYVLRDNVSLRGSDITNPQQSTDQAGNPDVTFNFNSSGGNKFHAVTAAIARRGQHVSTLGQIYDQHFAVALDDQLLTVPSIDYKVYPDGVTGGNGADITDGFTAESGKDLATELRFGALPLQLRLLR